MKNIRNLIPVVIFVSFLCFSCEKDGTSVTKVINVQLSSNESYSHAVPKGDDDDVMQFTKQADHSLKSEISPSGNNVIFNYTPALDFTGTDEVKISNVEEHHGNAHGGCSGHHHDDNVTYDFKISVIGNVK